MTDLPETKLRAQVEGMGGRFVRPVSGVLDAFDKSEANSAALAEISERLAAVGIGAEPPLSEVAGKGVFVTLYLLGGERPPEQPREAPQTVAAEQAATAAATASFAPVGAGILLTGGFATLVGFTGFWAYGVIFAALTLLTFGLVRWQFAWFARKFLRFLRFGFALGIVATLAGVLIVGGLLATPVFIARASAAESDAEGYVDDANTAMNQRHLRDAYRDLDRARARYGKDTSGLSDAEDRYHRMRHARRSVLDADKAFNKGDGNTGILLVKSARKDDPNVPGLPKVSKRADVFGTADAAFKQGDHREAVEILLAVNEKAGARGYARVAINQLLTPDVVSADGRLGSAETKRYLKAARSARSLASLAGISAEPAAAAVGSIKTRHARFERAEALAKERRVRLEAKRAEEKAAREQRAAEKAAAREQRELEKAAREREELQAQNVPSVGPQESGGKGAPCDNGYTNNWCGANRDADSDGCWCEGR